MYYQVQQSAGEVNAISISAFCKLMVTRGPKQIRLVSEGFGTTLRFLLPRLPNQRNASNECSCDRLENPLDEEPGFYIFV